MPAKKKVHCLFSLFEKFIRDSRTGRRLQPNGKKLSAGTVTNYGYTLQLLRKFSEDKNFELRIRPVAKLTSRELQAERNYWKKFYQSFSHYLYEDCGFYDNYAGVNMKHIRSFLLYLNKDLLLGVGELYRQLYVHKEEITIFPLLPEELNFLIYDRDFEASLSPRMQEVKDFVVFGCTVALRFSDLVALTQANLRQAGFNYYLATRSKKTGVDSFVKLPPYAIAIVNKYAVSGKRKKLLPAFNKVNLNIYIKRLFEQAGFQHPVEIRRSRRGVPVVVKADQRHPPLRFCDVASTHTMRRTAITTMLSLGVSEQVVRRISGHAPSSKEFYRYVSWAQTYLDQETEKMHVLLEERKLLRI